MLYSNKSLFGAANRKRQQGTCPSSKQVPISNLKVFTSNHPSASSRLKELKLHDDDCFEPRLWQRALGRFNFELRGQKKREQGDENIMIVALQNKKVVGFLHMSTVNNRLSKRPHIELDGCITFEVNYTSVSEQRRRGGIGTRIAEKTVAVVRRHLDEETPIGFILLQSAPNARAFWESVGFVEGYPDDLIDATPHMESTLDNAKYTHNMEVLWEPAYFRDGLK